MTLLQFLSLGQRHSSFPSLSLLPQHLWCYDLMALYKSVILATVKTLWYHIGYAHWLLIFLSLFCVYLATIDAVYLGCSHWNNSQFVTHFLTFADHGLIGTISFGCFVCVVWCIQYICWQLNGIFLHDRCKTPWALVLYNFNILQLSCYHWSKKEHSSTLVIWGHLQYHPA